MLLAGAPDLVVPQRALAAAAPLVHTRQEWNARPPDKAVDVLDTPPDHIVVHHTATSNTSDYSLEHAFSLSRAIQNYHMDRTGWIDIGQQLTISRGGHLMEGRDKSLSAITAGKHVVGAHAGGHNSHTVGIENEGMYVSEDTTTALFDMLVDTCAWLCTQYDLNPHEAIVGHRDYNATQCPGDVLYGRLPELRNKVARTLEG